MSSKQGVLLALRQLTLVPNEAERFNGIQERCSMNVTSVSLLVSRYGLDELIHTIKERYMLCDKNWPLDFKGKFVGEALALLIAFCSVDDEQKDQSNKLLLGVKDEQAIKGALQFVSLLGIYPYLSPGVGVPLKARTKADINFLKSSLPLCERNFTLYCCIKVLLDCSSNGILGPFIYSSVIRSDIIASLIQIIHCNELSTTDQLYIYPTNLTSCEDQLHVFMSRISPTVALQDLLILQKGKRLSRFWKVYNNACGCLMSSILIKADGLMAVFEAVFGSLKETDEVGGCAVWMKCHAISKIVSTCPSQVKSSSQYYEQICPQVLSLAKRDYQLCAMVACSIFSSMLKYHYKDACHYLVSPLFEPLLSLSFKGFPRILSFEELSSFLMLLNKLLTVSEPDSPFFQSVAEFFPILFKLWMFLEIQENLSWNGLPVMEILVKCLKSNVSAIQLKLFYDLLRIPFEEPVELDYKTFSDEYILILDNNGISLKSREDANEKKNSQLIEELGHLIVKLLTDKNLVECKLIGPVFTACIDCLVSVLTNDSVGSNVSSANNKELLKLESANTVHSNNSTLLLFVTATLCEIFGEKLLDEVEIPSLVISLITIIQYHAVNAREKEKIKLKPYCTVLVGGHITLSIAFGLLSAILTVKKEIPQNIRYPLTSILPDLKILSRLSDVSELASTADDLRVCIATLGAVWSCMQSTTIEHQMSTCSISNISNHLTTSNIPKKECNKLKTLPKVLSDILAMLNDPLLPVVGHGLIELARLVESKHPCTKDHDKLILTILADHLQHSDSYIFMAAIRGLVAMSSINSSQLVLLLCREYTITDKPLLDKCAIEKNMKVGEALVKVTTSLGDVLPFYCDLLVTAFLANAQHTEPLIRASALSNLAEICEHVKLFKVENEISSVLSKVIQTDPSNEAKQAAILVIKNIIICMGKSGKIEKLPESILPLYRLLKQTEHIDADVITKNFAEAAIAELNEQMKQIVFQTPKMCKKITVIP